MTEQFEVVVIGGGQAGLALGYYLAEQGRHFVILEAASRIGSSWRTRYDSLVLFTPAQYNNLPGLAFPAPPDTYPTKDEVATYLERYARTFNLPVRLGATVREVAAAPTGYQVESEAGTFESGQVVVATGPFQRPFVPPFASALASDVFQIHSSAYRNPEQLPPGDVLVVGAANSGAQIAAELAKSRRVYLSQGKKALELPQRVFGKDLFWWLYRLRLMDASRDSALGRRMSRSDPVIGTNIRALMRLHGLEVVGRAVDARWNKVTMADGRALKVHTIIWATGFRPDYGWIRVPVLDSEGRPVQSHGVTRLPGFYFLGLSWQHTRGSALLGGVGRDAQYLASRIAAHDNPLRSQPTADVPPPASSLWT